jgi:uncharacterized membrane protein YtjA (UPF0391 family)
MLRTLSAQNTPRVAAIASVNARPEQPSLWAPCLSALCFLHCAGMALIAGWIPTLTFFTEAPWLEWLLFGVSGLATFSVLRRVSGGRLAWLIACAGAVLATGGIAAEAEWAARSGFLVLAVLQFAFVFQARRRTEPACCPPETDCPGARAS